LLGVGSLVSGGQAELPGQFSIEAARREFGSGDVKEAVAGGVQALVQGTDGRALATMESFA